MQFKERAKTLGNDARQRMREAKLERADRDRERLRAENQLMRERIERSDGELSLALEALDELAKTDGRATRSPTRHPIRKLLVLAAAAGSAYVIGSKAARGSLESLHGWWAGKDGRSSMDDARMA